MRISLVVAALLGLAGCCNVNWDWYQECDLVEGAAYDACNMCVPDPCQEGMVVSSCYAVPVVPAAPAGPPAAPPPDPVTGPPSDPGGVAVEGNVTVP
jgi:hypothetical protein